MDAFLLLIIGTSVLLLVYGIVFQKKAVPRRKKISEEATSKNPYEAGSLIARPDVQAISEKDPEVAEKDFQKNNTGDELALLGLSRVKPQDENITMPSHEAPFSLQAIAPPLLTVRTWIFETFYAEQKRTELRQRCLNDFPEMLDIMTLGLNAGLSFDSSLELYIRRYQSVLSHLLKYSLMVWKLGLENRAQALDYCALKVQVPAFTRFSIAVTESLEFGMPLSETLMRQASEIRREQRLQVEEAIEKVPVKMLIPMGIFVVPAMLIAILGPLLSSALVVK